MSHDSPRKGSWQPQLPIIQVADSIEAGLEVTLLRCSSGKLSVRARLSILHFAVESGLGPESFSVEMKLFTLRLCSRLSSMPTVPYSKEWSVIWVEQHRSHYPLKSWPCSLTRTCCFFLDGRGRFRCSLLSPFREQSNVLFDVPMTRELMAVCQGAGNFGTSPDFSDCAGAHPHKNPS